MSKPTNEIIAEIRACKCNPPWENMVFMPKVDAIALCDSHESLEKQVAMDTECLVLEKEVAELKESLTASAYRAVGLQAEADAQANEIAELKARLENSKDARRGIILELGEAQAERDQLKKEAAELKEKHKQLEDNSIRVLMTGEPYEKQLLIIERDRLKEELKQGYQDYDALRIQKDNEIRALQNDNDRLKAEVERQTELYNIARREAECSQIELLETKHEIERRSTHENQDPV